MSERESGNGLAWFLAGTVVGTGVGLLFAPCSGRRMRESITGGTRDLCDRSREIFERSRELVDDAAELFERGRRLASGME